jgi:hypothetical protein
MRINAYRKGKQMKKQFILAAAVALIGVAMTPAARAESGQQSNLFIKSAVEHNDGTVTLPLHRGTSRGRTVYYVILDSSNGNAAQALGVNTSQKLANARNTAAVQKVTVMNGVIDFPASVDFRPERIVDAPNGFPPSTFQAGAVGEPGYSPLIQLPDGTIENAPHVALDANGDGFISLFLEAADKVTEIDTVNMTVRFRETSGFQGGNAVKYISTDASDPLAAALEDVTFAQALNAAPTLDDDSTASSRTSLAAFVNGQTGAANPQRQGLNSAVVDGLDPLNVLRWNPSQGRYSPLWDVHLSQWSDAAIAAGQNLQQHDYGDVQGLASHGLITGPGGAPFAASGFIVNCPIVSSTN